MSMEGAKGAGFCGHLSHHVVKCEEWPIAVLPAEVCFTQLPVKILSRDFWSIEHFFMEYAFISKTW